MLGKIIDLHRKQAEIFFLRWWFQENKRLGLNFRLKLLDEKDISAGNIQYVSSFKRLSFKILINRITSALKYKYKSSKVEV